jgi:predicted Zn-dependent protease
MDQMAADQWSEVEISFADERRFGAAIVEEYRAELQRQNLRVLERGRNVDYLLDLVNTIKPFMANSDRYRTVKVYLVDSPQIDARSFPGGTLVFFRGLLDFCGSEAALAGIVGHELSHLDHGHQLATLRRMKYFEQSMKVQQQTFVPERMFSAIRTMVEGYARPFRPEDEAEADRDGAAWAYRAGYDPRELATLFLRLHRRGGDEPGRQLPFLQSHPFRLDRYRAIQAQYAELQQTSPTAKLYVGRRNLSQRTSRLKHDFEGEHSN